MAPEILEGKPYKGTSVDVFALGVTLFAVVTGVMPFERRANKDSDQLYQLIFKNEESAFWETLQKMYSGESYFIGVQNLSEEFKKFIMMFFRYNYFERITLEQIKQSFWFNNTTSTGQQSADEF